MSSSPITRRYATLLALSALAFAVAAASAPAFTGPSTPSHDQPLQSLPSQDLRSPDTRDVAIGYDPEPVAVAAPEPSGSGEGFDWVSAALGGAAIGGLILLLVGFMDGHGWRGVGRSGRRGALHT